MASEASCKYRIEVHAPAFEDGKEYSTVHVWESVRGFEVHEGDLRIYGTPSVAQPIAAFGKGKWNFVKLEPKNTNAKQQTKSKTT